jgi:hypothetical protein
MADQTVKLESDSGSHERVALDLMKLVIAHVKDQPPKDVDGILHLYKKCRQATFQSPT